MATDNKRKLYDALSQDYDMGSYEQFCDDLNDDGKRRKLYDATSQDYDFGTWDSFSQQLGYGQAASPVSERHVAPTDTPDVSTPPQVSPPKATKYFKLRRGGKDFTVSTDDVNAAGGLAGWAKANPGAPLRVYMQGKKEDGTDFDGHVDLSVAHDRRKNRGYKYTTTSEAIDDKPWQPTEQEKIAMSHRVYQMQAQTDEMLAESRERMENVSEYYRGNNGLGFQTVEGKPIFNPESGKMEKTYLTPTGDRTTSKALADASTSSFRQAMAAADMSVGAQIRRAEAELAELRKQLDESASRVHKEWADDYEKNSAPLAAVLAANTYVPRQTADKENSALRVAIRQREEQLNNLYEERDRQIGKDVGFWRGFGRTVSDVRTWDFGTGDVLDAMTMLNADQYSSPNATEGEKSAGQEMLKAVYDAQQTEQMYGENASFWNRAGVMTGYMPSFMLDFVLTGGGYEAIDVAGKAATHGAVKIIGKEAIKEMTELGVKKYAKKYGVRGVGRMAENWTIKALGTTADELLIRAPLMTNTLQAGKTTADIIDRKLGDVVVDEDGNYDFSNDETWGSAIWQGEANAIIENYSEMFGTHLDGVVPALAKTFGGKRISGMLARANASSYGQILATTRKQFERLGVSDYFGEVSEEYYGQLWRTMLNLDDAYTNVPVYDEQGNQVLDADGNPVYERKNLLFTGQFHGDIWGGMALSLGLMGAGKYTISGIAYGNMKHQVNVADRVAAEIFTPDRWEPIREIIDNTTNEDMGALAVSMVNDPNLSDEERAAVMGYMERSLNLRGLNLGAMAQSRGAADEEVDGLPVKMDSELSQSYIDGYEASTPREMNDAQNMFEYQRQRAESMFDNMILEALEQSPVAILMEMSRNGLYSQEEIDAARDYINAKTVRDGILQRVNDNIDEQIAQSDAMINARVNPASGMIQPAVMGLDDRQVYVVGGSLAINDDGTIDRDASDESIVVRDAVTGELEFTAPKSIVSTGEAIDPEMEKAMAVDNIRQQAAQAAADAMNGTLAFNPGDVVQINDGGGVVDVTIVGPLVDEESGMPIDGQIIVQFANGQQTAFAKEQLQAFADAANIERLNNFERERAANRTQQQATESEAMRPQYALNDEFTILNDSGTPIRGSITGELDEDGTVEIYTEEPINGNRVNRLTPAELEEMLDTYNGEAITMPVPENVETVPKPEEVVETEPQASALSRIPIDEQGQPKYDEAEPDTAWDAIVEQAQGDEATAAEVVADIVAERQADFNAAEKALDKTKEGKPEKRKKGDPAPTMAERIAAKNAAKEALAEAQAIRDRAKAILDHWKKIADTKQRRDNERRNSEEAEARRLAQERAEEEARLRAEREEAARIEREALNGVPDWAVDTPADARARGYRRNGSRKVDRPEIIDNHAIGKAVEVKFGDDVIPTGNVVVIEASQLQPSHRDGQRNPAHFLDEAQPKERKDAASRFAAAKIAEGMRPEEITSSVTAFTGAPSINARGEVIQGNNRSEALRLMYDDYAQSAERYKQYLIDHAAEFGLTPEAIAAFEHPVLVNMLDVSDENAITLGQYVAQDTESGGIERIKPKNAVQKMGDKIRNFANLLLQSADDEASFAQLVDANGVDVLKWMNQQGFISNTQYASAFDSKGNLSAEAANDLKGIMYQSIFTDGSTRLEEMFNKMPAKAQRAILATAFRDYDSAFADRMIGEIQQSILAFNQLMAHEQFAEATNYDNARIAVDGWSRQYAMDIVSGESYIPAEKFSNFALILAAMYKGSTQKNIQATFNALYDAVQGTEADNLFESGDKTSKSLAEAIRKVFNVEYKPIKKNNNGNDGSTAVDNNVETSQGGRPGSRGDVADGERAAAEEGPADGGGGTTSDSGQGNDVIIKLSDEDVEATIASMKAHAVIMPSVEITDENWRNDVTTPLGTVKMGENQKDKLFAKGREQQYGMLLETLGNPDIILEEADEQDNIFHERPSSYIFIKTFQKEDGSKYVHFESVTVSQDGMEVSISSHIIRENQLRNKMKNDRLLYKATALDKPASLPAEQPINEGGSLSSDGKDTETSQDKQESGEESSAPSNNEADDSKKSHGKVGAFDVTAEQEAEKEREEAEAKLKEKRKKRTNPDGSTTETVVDSGREIEITGGDFISGDTVEDNTVDAAALVVPEQRPASDLIGDSAAFQEREAQTVELVEEIGGVIESRVAMLQLDAESVKPLTMTDVKKMASKYPALNDISDTDLQELVELAMTQLTRSEALINIDGTAEEQRRAYDHIVDLYQIQPSLNARDSERLMKQQYSTPTPFGYVMGQFVRAGGKAVGSMLEPSAGNGALTITVHPSLVHVNDIDDARLTNLRKLGYGQVTAQDALLPFTGDKVDVVMTNPPFGTITEKVYDGIFRISSLEAQMAINALEQMKDDGRASIVIGGNTSYRTNGSMNPKDAAFFGYLYSHYNVADVINISGKALYSRNGTGYDVRMILIDGRKTGEFKRVFPPVKAKARAEQVTTFDELYKRVQDDIQQIQQMGSKLANVQREPGTAADGTASASVRTGNNRPNTGAGQRPGTTGDTVRDTPRTNSGQPTSGNDGSSPAGVDNAVTGNAGSTDDVPQPNPEQSRSVGSGSAQNGTGRSGSDGRGAVASRPDRGAERLAVKPDLTTEKVAYPNQSENCFTLMSVVPAAQAQVLQKSLGEIAAYSGGELKVGDVDQYLVEELGYSSKEELYKYLAAEQIDSVALAIHQMNKGNAFIIGDMTGVGKGRQGAALIRYAVKQGKVPIYFTQKPTLFTDNYRDLADIGSSDLRPFIIASNPKDANIVDTDGNIVHKLPSKKEQERVFNYIMEHGTLPEEYDYVLTTYDQIKNGTADYAQNEDGTWNVEARKLPKKSTGYTTADHNGQARRDALAQLAEGNIAILDESHTVGGDSGCGRYMQMLTSSAEGVTFLSATFAKRADNMPIYAQRTAIAESGVKASELIDAIGKGGVTLQEIMSKQLVESGQMIRRERSLEGVTIDWLSVDDETDRRQREQFNEVADIFNAIRNFQDDYITPIIDAKNEAAAEFGATVGHTQGTKDLGVKNVPFASKMYNLVNQLLFALKVDAVADRVVENLRNGYKPVISFTNTMEGFLSSAPKGVAMDDVPNFSLTLMRALDGVMRFTEKDADENTEGGSISLSDLSTEGQNAYNSIREKIINLSADLPISPMDAIRMKIEEAGYSVAEITGRTMQLNRTEDGRYIVEARKDRDKKAAMRDFNSGKLDVLMINKSGSTGISLHASSKFEDQRPRVMVFAQFQSDINDEVQMRGRIDRSGQVTRGRYEYIMSTIPAEQRIQMMFKAKLKSLDANTTSSQKSKFNEMEIVDYLNKYGDDVVWEYMKEHPELEERLGDPLDMLHEKKAEEGPRTSEKEDTSKKTGCAGKISRYLAFLSVEEQDEIFREITEAYRVKIQLLDDAGENDLEITTMPLRAETKKKKIWHEGENPGSGNAFADNTYVEEVEVDVLKKPMKRDEIVEATRKLMGEHYTEKNGGVDWQHYVRAKGDEISLFFQAKADEAVGKLREAGEARIAKAREKAVTAATKARGRGENNFTDEQIQSLADTVANEEREKELQKQRKRQEEIMAIKHRLQSLLQRLRAGGIYVVPQDLKQGTAEMFTQTYGTFVGFKFNKGYTLGSSTAIFATLDGRRKVELALSDQAINTIISATEITYRYSPDEIRAISLENWDSKVPTQTRQKRYIITGNLLQALVDTEKGEKTRGNLISFSTIDGETRQGILMGENFKLTDLRNSASLSSRLAQIREGKAVVSENGDVQIEKVSFGWQHRGQYELRVPKSKQRGGIYTMYPDLLKLVEGHNFITKGNNMVAYVEESDIAKVVDMLNRAPFNLTVLQDSQLSDVSAEEAEDDVLCRPVTDKATLDRLNTEPTIKVYRAMQMIDGGLRPPMSAKVDGQLRDATEVGVWEEAEEHPEMADENGRFKLDKGNGKSIKAAYNPYIHTSRSPINDQFSSAWSRPELVAVEVEVPVSELTSEYHAEKAKDTVGEKEWKSGPVGRALAKIGQARRVILSRWSRVVRVVPVEEVAEAYAQRLNAHGIEVPFNTVPPALRDALVERGVKIGKPEKGNAGSASLPAFEQWINEQERHRMGDGAYSDAEISFANDPISKVMGKNRFSKKRQAEFAARERQRMVERVKELAERMHLNNVDIITDVSQLEGKRAKAKGFYNKRTGKITIVIPNNVSTIDAEQTLLHEAVAHYGLRQLFGEQFNTFLDNVYQSADESIRRKIAEMAAQNGWDFRTATEEYLAGLAEDTNFREAQSYTGWWSKVKRLFIDMLDKIGFKGFRDNVGVVLTDNELRYILWRSYENLAEPGRYRSILGEATDVAKQEELKVGNYAEQGIEAEYAAEGDLYRPGDFSPRDRVFARYAYDSMVRSGNYQFKEAVQDSMLGLKMLYQAILGKKTRIEDVAGFENAYLFENRMSSMNAGEQHEYFQRYMQPLLKEIGRIAGANKRKRRELTDYIMAKHGLERNEYMRNEAAANGEETDRDFAGLMGLTGESDWHSAEATAQQWVDDYEDMVDTTALWEAINKATNATLEKIYLSGIISKETYEKILGMYSYYIPLRGWDETTSEQVYGYLTSKDGPLGGSIMKKAEGRESMADDPIATIGMMADDAIRQGNRNLMKQRFLNFILNHPSDTVSVHDIWLEYKAVTDEWVPVFADVEDTDTADEVAQKVEAFEHRMEALRTAEPDKYKKGREAQQIPYKVVRGKLREHQILIKRNGRTFVATINGNPRAAQAINGLTNPDVDQNGVEGNMLKAGTWVNRQLSAFYTTRNPDFVVGNFFRDMLYSNCMTWVKESSRYARRFHKNFGRVNPIVMRRLLGKWENGTLNMSNRLESLFYQFMKNGGETGYTNVRDIDGHKRAVAAELKKQGSTGRRVWTALGMQLDLLNRSAENCARFAAFVTSREFGRSIDRAIYDAKEISVNFNKKGSGGKMVNANVQTHLGKAGAYLGGVGRLLFVFWNAGIQGMTNFGRQAKLHPVKFSAGATALFTLGYVIPMLAQMMGGGDGDDDDKNAYYNLPDYLRRSNICFYAGDQWITIPLPIEYRAMYGMGELAHGVISGNERYSNSELARQMASQVSQILPIDMLEGGGGISPFIPSAAKPFTEAYIMNKGWTGLPVYKDTPFNKNDPEWSKAYASADKHLVDFAKWLNETSGGDDFKKGSIDINPAKIEYLLNGTFGGLFTFPNKIKKTGETMFGNRDFEWRNMPIANRLIKSGDERTANRKLQNEYFKYLKEYEATGQLMRKYENADEDGVLGYAERINFLENSPEYARWEIFDEFKGDIDAYREEISAETNEEELSRLKSEMYAVMRKLVNALHDPEAYRNSEQE